MKIYNGLNGFSKLKHAVVTSGTFDGVHYGHRKIIDRLCQIAKNDGGETVLITFWPHPRLVLYPNEPLHLLNTLEEREALLAENCIDHLIRIPFTKDFAQLSSTEFIQQILIDGIGTKKLVIGYDHRFGKNREGSFDHLTQNSHNYGFEIEEIPRQEVDDMGVSSTKIRNALSQGAIEQANHLLGYKYHLTGNVTKGDEIGRRIGFPTANIFVNSPIKLVPADGVYTVRVRFEESWYGGMLYIGKRPTLNGQNRSIEVNIFNFDQNIYDKDLTIEFICHIRGDMHFDNLDALQTQLSKDKLQSQSILLRYEK
ncbi:MAG: bifunctional riboflavin kinase/FAD synthetase [Cyclobacteriaceae bacterium]|nr:bifunctional riboflavin kinase/FAD synthetase [Cyclobacteriaceae bacterium]